MNRQEKNSYKSSSKINKKFMLVICSKLVAYSIFPWESTLTIKTPKIKSNPFNPLAIKKFFNKTPSQIISNPSSILTPAFKLLLHLMLQILSKIVPFILILIILNVKGPLTGYMLSIYSPPNFPSSKLHNPYSRDAKKEVDLE